LSKNPNEVISFSFNFEFIKKSFEMDKNPYLFGKNSSKLFSSSRVDSKES
jgi:hypothetical protein